MARSLTRRDFIRDLGLGAASLPFLLNLPGLGFANTAGRKQRLVPIGELTSGLALVLGIWTPLFAFIAFFMALNFQIASGAVFKYSFLTSGYGLPVLGASLALALGGVRLPWSIRS